MTDEQIDALVKHLAPVIRDYVQRALNVQAKAFNERLATLEARPTLEYQGTWAAEQPYTKGNAVTFDGSVWIARSNVKGVKPGDGGAAWQLAVKRGASAR
jgi:hypothetical protein